MKAYAGSKTPPVERDRRATPPAVFERIQEVSGLRFIHDVCADERNRKCESYWSEADDAFSFCWRDRLPVAKAARKAAWLLPLWMNPPYSDPYPWCATAAREARRGLVVMGLLPDDRSTEWYQHWIEDVATVCWVPDKRISFLGPDGRPQSGNPKGAIFPLWTPWRTGRTEFVRFAL